MHREVGINHDLRLKPLSELLSVYIGNRREQYFLVPGSHFCQGLVLHFSSEQGYKYVYAAKMITDVCKGEWQCTERLVSIMISD